MTRRQERPAYVLGLRYLEEHGAMPLEDLAELLGLKVKAVKVHLARWIKEERAHIKSWNRRKGEPQAVLAPGPGRQAPRIQPLTKSQRNKNYRATHRARLQAQHRAKKAITTPFQQLGLLIK